MCEACREKIKAWRGWGTLPPASKAELAAGPWMDLSHSIGPQTPTMAIFPAPSVTRVLSLPKDPANITQFQMVVHQGTHIDAPCHIFADGPSMGEISPERFTGRGVVVQMTKNPFDIIDVTDFKNADVAIEAGDIVLVDTGWHRHVRTSLYEQHPSFSETAASWLVEKGIKLVGVDFATPDLSPLRRPPNFTWPVHLILLGNGILVGEHLTNLSALANQRVEVLFSPLNIDGSDGAPARVLARKVSAERS
jgi:kynurenine formamidase